MGSEKVKFTTSQEAVDQQSTVDTTANKVIGTLKYKRGNSTRKIIKQLKNKGLWICSNSMEVCLSDKRSHF